jgi:hypothetical protein
MYSAPLCKVPASGDGEIRWEIGWEMGDGPAKTMVGTWRWETGDRRLEYLLELEQRRIDSCLPGAQLHGATMLPSRHVSDSSLVGLV